MTNITDTHREIFEALTAGKYGNFALFSCFLNGEPAAAIVCVDRDDDDYIIQPLFVSVTDRMVLTDHSGHEPRKEPPPAAGNGRDKVHGDAS